MEIETKISELFRAKDVEDKPKDTNSVMELKKIENQLNIHMKNKQGLKYKKVSLVYNHSYDKESFSQVIDQELVTKMANKKWKALPMFMKWKAVQDYLSENDITDEIYIKSIKKKLIENKLEVECHDHTVVKIM
jgi:translation elongation factor EF-G